MAGVKSFRIEDLLLKKTGNIEDDLKKRGMLFKHGNLQCNPNNPEWNNTTGAQSERHYTSSEDSQYETRSTEKELESRNNQDDKMRYELSSPGTILPYNGTPMIFPLGTIRSPSSTFGSDAGLKPPSYTNVLPFSFESSRLGQPRSASSYGRLEAPMLPTNFSAFQHGQFQPTMEYLSYPSYIGHFGVPIPTSIGDSYEKRQFMNDRLHYSMYPLGRSLYPTTCKRKGGQIRFNNSQTAQLEKAFVQQKYLNANDRKKLAQSLGLTDRQVKTWFQNRRAKLRKCKGGVCTESEVSGSPLDSRATSPYENVRYDTPLDVKSDN